MGGVRPSVRRGEVWDAEFDPIRGREQAGRRPALVVSADRLQGGHSGLAFVVPLTRTDRGFPSHVAIEPPEGGPTARSFAMCDQLRVVTLERFDRRRGQVSEGSLTRIENVLRLLLDL